MKSKNVLLGVTGGIAAYKACYIASGLSKAGYNVDVIMTKSATEFVTPLTFETLTHNRVVEDMFHRVDHREVEHIELAKKADMVLIAPATYNIVGKVAGGIADDMLSTVISATKAPVYFALAMNKNMYTNPIFEENVEKLKKLRYNFIEAGVGRLAERESGVGRMKEPKEIIQTVNDYFNRRKSLKGKKILVSAGRTEEPIDPIRYLSNRSTGKMGYSIAEAAKNMGANVTLVSGPSNLKDIIGVEMHRVRTAVEMHDVLMREYKDSDIVIMSAAVADYRMKELASEKIKKTDGNLFLELERNPDILKNMGKTKSGQFLVGFAAESQNLIENAKGKLQKKNLDMIVANNVSGFAGSKNEVCLISKNGIISEIPEMDKNDLAYLILDKIVEEKEGDVNDENNV